MLGKCCFNHIIGLPEKDGETKPIFDYEMEIYKYLQKGRTDESYKHLWIKKARGLGLTEFFLRYMGWLALYDDTFKNKRFVVITGPRERTARDLIRRMRHMFGTYSVNYPLMDSLTLNNVLIEAFPSNTASLRGYEDFKFILLDEADYFRPSEQEELLPAVRGFIVKTQPWIVMVSTPHQPNSLFNRIEQMQSDEDAGFKRLHYLYERGVAKIYDPRFIEEEKRHDYFKREYEGQYSYGVGNLFSEANIIECERLGRELDAKLSPDIYNLVVSQSTRKSLGIDLGYGSSRTAFTLTEFVDGKIRVLLASQFDRPDSNTMVQYTYNLIRTHGLDNGRNKTFVDGSEPDFIARLKSRLGEDKDYLKAMAKARQAEQHPMFYMNIVPIMFGRENQSMIGHVKTIIDRHMLAINPDRSQGHQDLLSDLRVAKNKPDSFKLDKSAELKMDLFDSLRLSLELYR